MYNNIFAFRWSDLMMWFNDFHMLTESSHGIFIIHKYLIIFMWVFCLHVYICTGVRFPGIVGCKPTALGCELGSFGKTTVLLSAMPSLPPHACTIREQSDLSWKTALEWSLPVKRVSRYLLWALWSLGRCTSDVADGNKTGREGQWSKLASGSVPW